MLSPDVQHAVGRWPDLAQIIFVPHSESDYQNLVNILDQLIEEVGEDESHPLASLMELVGVLVKKYEDEHVPEIVE
jgi:HTH-type transcriptional regulator/antitoxin HigA